MKAASPSVPRNNAIGTSHGRAVMDAPCPASRAALDVTRIDEVDTTMAAIITGSLPRALRITVVLSGVMPSTMERFTYSPSPRSKRRARCAPLTNSEFSLLFVRFLTLTRREPDAIFIPVELCSSFRLQSRSERAR